MLFVLFLPNVECALVFFLSRPRPAGRMTYPSKKDLWIVCLVFPVSLMLIGFGVFFLVLPLNQGAPWVAVLPGAAITVVGAILLWALFSTSFEITPTHLIVRFGPVRWRIRVEAIAETIDRTGIGSDSAIGFAWSLDRVVIRLRKRNGKMALLGVAISPEDKERFLQELAEAIDSLNKS